MCTSFPIMVGTRVAALHSSMASRRGWQSWTTVQKRGARLRPGTYLKGLPGLRTCGKLHYSDEGGAQHNVATEFIANPEGPDSGHYLKLIAWEDGKMEVFNSRTEKTKTYAPLNSGHN